MREMKDSGIEWIGEIPKEWGLRRIQYCLEELDVKNNPIQTTNVLSLIKDKGVIPYEEKGEQGNKAKENISEYHLAYPNTIVLNCMNILIGSVGISKYFGCVSPVYYVFKETNFADLRFINYIFTTRPFQKELRKYANGILEIRLRVSANDIFKQKIVVPCKSEQRHIANFLDEKCGEIDSLTKDIQEQIATLEEYKKSVITEIVTKGLDLNVEMKDSGIEWVGEIPAGWEIWPIYHYFNERKNKNKLMRETNLLSLSYGNVIRKDINSNGGLLPENFSSYNIIEPCDIVIRPTDLQNDKRSLRTGYVNEHGIITSAYITLKPKMGVNSKYYHYLLHAYDLMKVFYNMGNGVRQGLNYNEFSKLLLVSPPKNEQDDIVNYLDSKCSEIDAIIQTKKEQLDVLTEYKKSLIYEYVTGKKEVPFNE